jgi:Uma2 family endonuclease
MSAILPSVRPRAADDSLPELLFQVPLAAHALAGFREWVKTLPEKAKVALLDGEVLIDMSNEDFERHVSLKGAIFAAIYRIVLEEDLGQVYQDGGLLTNEAAKLACNPDAVAVLWKSLASGRVKFHTEDGGCTELQGSPDWVLEVVSPSSVTKDTRRLRGLYHAAGIPEYWLTDARRDLSFTILHRRKSGYAAAADEDGWQWSKVFGRYFRLRLDTRHGLRHYVLDSAVE